MRREELQTIKTYDTTAQEWVELYGNIKDLEWEARRLKDLLPAGGKILEIGCGSGRDAAELLRLGFDYLGTDASAGMIGAAQAKVPSGNFQHCSVYDLTELSPDFDGFWACAVLLHIPRERIDEALQATSACLKLGAIGMISIKDGNTEEFEISDARGFHEERLFVYWRKDDFTEVLKRNGFSLLEYDYKPVNQRTNWHVFFVEKDGDLYV